MVDNQGSLTGERKMTVSGDIVYSNGDTATENGFTASEAGIVAMVPVVASTETGPLLAGGATAAGAASTVPVVGIVVAAVFIIYPLVLVLLCIFGGCESDPTPTPTPPLPDSSIVLFGNIDKVEHKPDKHDYSQLGGASAIRRTGELETFTMAPYLPGTDWVQATNGAAIKSNGTLATWNPGSTQPVWNPCGTGKTYVAIAQWHDWLLTLYLDKNNQTYLEPIANPASPREIFKNTPSGTGWKKIAAGNNHALALMDNGTLFSWGKDDYHQMELPAGIAYRDIDAGDNFSLALSRDGTIYASGLDTYGQVSGIPAGNGYIAISAGAGSGAALTKNGTIVMWGQKMPGAQPPTGA